MKTKQFLQTTFLIAGGSAGLLSFPLFRFTEPEVARGVLGGMILATLGAVSWLVFLARGWDRSYPVFLTYFLGGILFRLTLFVTVTVAAIVTGALNLPGFLGALFLYFVVFQVLEIRYLQKWTPAPVSREDKIRP